MGISIKDQKNQKVLDRTVREVVKVGQKGAVVMIKASVCSIILSP